MIISANEIPEIIETIPNFKEKAVEASKEFQKQLSVTLYAKHHSSF